MNVKSWGIFDKTTGVLRCNYSGPEHTIQEQLGPNEDAVEGTFDMRFETIDPETKGVVAVRPSSPGKGYYWDEKMGAWLLTPELAQAQLAKEEAQKEIERLESKQARAVREALLGVPDAKTRLEEIDDRIADLRLEMVAAEATAIEVVEADLNPKLL